MTRHAQQPGRPTCCALQSRKESELAQLRTTEESALASAVLANYSEAQRERGEIAELHSKHDVLRECALALLQSCQGRCPVECCLAVVSLLPAAAGLMQG